MVSPAAKGITAIAHLRLPRGETFLHLDIRDLLHGQKTDEDHKPSTDGHAEIGETTEHGFHILAIQEKEHYPDEHRQDTYDISSPLLLSSEGGNVGFEG